MRWQPRIPPRPPKRGTTRVVTKFLWWPKTSYIIHPVNSVGNGAWNSETRWLETCQVHQTYVASAIMYDDYWRDDNWIDK